MRRSANSPRCWRRRLPVLDQAETVLPLALQGARPERAAQLPPDVPEQRRDARHGRQPGIPRHAAHREWGDQPSPRSATRPDLANLDGGIVPPTAGGDARPLRVGHHRSDEELHAHAGLSDERAPDDVAVAAARSAARSTASSRSTCPALQSLLAATGPVTLADGDVLDSGNAARCCSRTRTTASRSSRTAGCVLLGCRQPESSRRSHRARARRRRCSMP